MDLYHHQQAIIDLFPKRHLIAWQVRCGKTRAAIGLMNRAGCAALIITPKKLKDQWGYELLEHAQLAPGQEFRTITKEEFRAQAKKLPKFNTVIVDEAHHFSGQKSILSRYLEIYIKVHNVEHVYLLTGTVYRSSPWNVYRLARILGHDWNYMEFRRKFFTEKYMGRGVIYEPRKNCQDELADLVRSIGSIVRLEDCTDMPSDPDPILETGPMTESQEALLKEMVESESNPLTRFGKSHQIASGLLLGNEFAQTKNTECWKDARLVELVNEYDKALIFCRYLDQIARYESMFKSLGIPCITITGETKDIESVRAKAREMTYGAVIISMGCSEGYALHEFSCTIYPSLSYSFLDFEQSQGRTKHMKKTSPNVYYILATKGSADFPVYESIKNKRSFSEAVYVREHMV